MKYQYELDVYAHSMAIRPSVTKTGIVELPNRPMVGEEVQVEGEWHRIATIRHTSEGMLLKLTDHYPND